MNAYELGQKARQEGKNYSTCPYRPLTIWEFSDGSETVILRRSWFLGFNGK